MSLFITKDDYIVDIMPIDKCIKTAEAIILHGGSCAKLNSYYCDTCCLSGHLLKSGESLCGSNNLGTGSEYSNNKVFIARQFIDLFGKPKVLHVNFMEE